MSYLDLLGLMKNYFHLNIRSWSLFLIGSTENGFFSAIWLQKRITLLQSEEFQLQKKIKIKKILIKWPPYFFGSKITNFEANWFFYTVFIQSFIEYAIQLYYNWYLISSVKNQIVLDRISSNTKYLRILYCDGFFQLFSKV